MQRLSQAVQWIDAELCGADAAVSGASIDTRSLRPGDLFVALSGSHVDGHDFIERAAVAGAAGALVSRLMPVDLPQILVADVLSALQDLAIHWRRAWAELSGGLLAGVTGSNGKTSVKTMLASILSQGYKTFATHGNLNNHIGVPLSVLNVRPEHQRAVIEMGANHPGEIAALTAIAQPDVGVITNAGDAHLEGFGSRQGVARAKGELFAAMGAGQTAVVNADDAYASIWRELSVNAQSLEFGRTHGDVLAINERGACFELRTPKGACSIELQLLGTHNVMNALAAAATAQVMGASLEQIKSGLEAVAPVQGRLQLQDIRGVRVINDAYNANPNSMAAAIDVLVQQPPVRHLVIGDMAELGESARAAHAEIGALALQRGIDSLWACGSLSSAAVEAFGAGARHFPDQASLAAALNDVLQPGDTVLVKGSRSAEMERVIQALEATD